MDDPSNDLRELKQAFELFTQSTHALEHAHQQLQARAEVLSEELAARNRELALANDYLDCILQSMSDGMMAVDTNGVITKFNRSAGIILGYAPEEVIGHSFRDLFGRDFSVRTGVSTMRLRTRNGRVIPISERDAPIEDRAGNRLGYVKVFQDLSELEALREQVRQIDRLALIGEMAATVAHEIRNPLGGIRGFASLLARDIPPDDPRTRLVEKILVGVKSLNSVVNELLEYTRPVELQLRPADCAELVDAAISYLEIGDRPIAVRNRVKAGMTIVVDPDKMRQVLLNILINAQQSIDGNGEIRIDAESSPDAVTIAISDNGCGIAREALHKVFSPFFSTKEKGTGLGLAVAAKIVESHGGALTVDSEPGNGSTFSIRLPHLE